MTRIDRRAFLQVPVTQTPRGRVDLWGHHRAQTWTMDLEACMDSWPCLSPGSSPRPFPYTEY